MHGKNQFNLDLKLLGLFVKIYVCIQNLGFFCTYTHEYIVCTQLVLSKTCYLFL